MMAVIAFVTSCTKEEQPTPKTEQDVLAEFVLKKQNVEVNGVQCDMYEHPVSGQVVYCTKTSDYENKAIKYDKKFYKYNGEYICNGHSNQCDNSTVGGQEVIILKKEKQNDFPD